MVLTLKEKLEKKRKELARLRSKKEIQNIGMKKREELRKVKAEIHELKYGGLKRGIKRIGKKAIVTGKVVGKRVQRAGRNIESQSKTPKKLKKKRGEESYMDFISRI